MPRAAESENNSSLQSSAHCPILPSRQSGKLLATAAMLKAGANQAATGENAIVVCSRTADVIIGPIGIVIANSLLGEITPRMAMAVAQSPATRILIPMNRCNNLVAGVNDCNTGKLVQDAICKLQNHLV